MKKIKINEKKSNLQKNLRINNDEVILNIHSTRNNTIITLSEMNGNLIFWSSGGRVGFKNSKKKTAFASQLALETLLKKNFNLSKKAIHIRIKGKGPGREPAIRGILKSKLKIKSFKEITAISFNGCRLPKLRRL
uniref:Ribosomal protein S11 n=1 Tax=Nitzschia sp. (in: diatoms) TaxID=1884248 RepID=A0A5J6DUL4_9STRA|nr:ribosomal protein S11 [Nitzschia sp. (in: diatoms)]